MASIPIGDSYNYHPSIIGGAGAIGMGHIASGILKSSFTERVKSGVLKRFFEPRYDTIVIEPGNTISEHILFTVPVGQQGKTLADTNMVISRMLGTPLTAYWEYIHVHFEEYHNLGDVLLWKELAEIDLLDGFGTKPLWRGSAGAMTPFLPRGGRKLVERKIHSGIIKFWPWLEASLEPIIMDSYDGFTLRVRTKHAVMPKHRVRIKFSLGPSIYRPY